MLHVDPFISLGYTVFSDIKERFNKMNKSAYHTHLTEAGTWAKCYHKSKTLLGNWQFWIGLTFGFPLEHLLWEKVYPFSLITHWLGL